MVPGFKSNIGQKKTLHDSPAAGNLILLNSTFTVHSTSFSPILFKVEERERDVMISESDSHFVIFLKNSAFHLALNIK